MIGVGVVAFVIVILIVMAIIIYNTQKELSALKKEDTLLVFGSFFLISDFY